MRRNNILIITILISLLIAGVSGVIVYLIIFRGNDDSKNGVEVQLIKGDIRNFAGDCTVEDSFINCSQSFLKEYKCDYVNLTKFGGSLDKTKEIMQCAQRSESKDGEENIYRTGCMLPVNMKYLVKDTQSTRLISTVEEFDKEFATVDSEEEAAAFVLAKTGNENLESKNLEGNIVYLINKADVKPIEVVKTGNDFKVYNTYSYRLCGCGNHTYSVKDYLVKKNGEIELLSSKEAFYDKASEGLCID